ncbi:F-box only protein 28 [Chelonus insularis]|uniref:F-box only protein 28 n=1 Tax=Chelonus insularis TaxID=460826 RepID=UPI00158D461C|nr:F-box only protein 28 [Chelonus insularis]
MLLIDLPDVVLETILSNLSYDEIAKNRLVCKHFDRTCQKLLNRGFSLMEKYHAQCLRTVKSQLPRRESERRSHPLARHCDVLTAIETRISMLSMTFIKYVNLHLCCFIPGKVIDEIFRVLRLIRDSKTPPRAHEILQELRDISSMAMEHFDEKILPALKHSIGSSAAAAGVSGVGTFELPGGSFMISHHHHSGGPSSTSFQTVSSDKLNQTFKKIYNRTKKNKLSFLSVKSRLSKLRLRMKRQGCQMRLQSVKLQEQSKKIHEQDLQIAEMRRHLEEWEQKMGDLTAELSRAREESQKPEPIDGQIKRKHIINQVDDNMNKDLQAKKRKLIVERKVSSDAKDIKFKKYVNNLLSNNNSTDS